MQPIPRPNTATGASDLALCHAAQINLYTLAMNCRDTDLAARALFLLSEMEHYDERTLPTRARRRQIEGFLQACASLRQHIEARCPKIPTLSNVQEIEQPTSDVH